MSFNQLFDIFFLFHTSIHSFSDNLSVSLTKQKMKRLFAVISLIAASIINISVDGKFE